MCTSVCVKVCAFMHTCVHGGVCVSEREREECDRGGRVHLM